MPLLRKKEFQKSTIPELLRDDEEVFHCEVTNEIFRDYDEFCQRIILVNSMVWSCAMTGKANLTYAEALQSEQTAKKSLKDFPMELRIPVLYLASKTKRSAFGEMAEDVFAFIKDRFFVGEIVESSFTENNWRESHVLQVIAPSDDQADEYLKTNGKSPERTFYPPAALFRYEVEQLDANDQDSSQVMMLEANHVRRKKRPYTKEKNRLFLKQFVELNDQGIVVIKEAIRRKYKLDNVRFDQIFDGPLPDFEHTKKATKAVNGKKTRQETLAKYLGKVDGKTNNNANNGKSLLEEMKRKEDEYKQKLEEMKAKRAEEKILEKQKRKEENLKMSSYVKEWYKPRDDLELEDQKILPAPTLVQSKIPAKYFGDALMVLEFTHSFSNLLSTKDFFPGGLTMDLLERALAEKEVAGPLTDIVQMLLTTLFNIQDEEAAENKTSQSHADLNSDDMSDTVSLSEATRLATLAFNWSQAYQGMPMGRLPLYPLTLSEVLRLHLLSSGARVNEAASKWRYQQRGGYTNEDDPGLTLRVKHPHILKALSFHNVNQLPIGDKLKILTCLIDQLLTYADVRDSIEERLDKTKQLKSELRSLQIAERRHEQEVVSTRLKVKREHKGNPDMLQKELTKIQNDTDKKRSEFERKTKDVLKSLSELQILLGSDRSYQRYIKSEVLPGFFVENDERNPGRCIDKIVVQKPELVGADHADTLIYVKKLYEECYGSDKENHNGIKKTPKKVNGIRHSTKVECDVDATRDLLMCTASIMPCPVHSNEHKPSWSFYHNKADVQALISSLNKRGIRESELRQALETDKDHIENIVMETNATRLNPTVDVKLEDGVKEDKPIPKKVQNMLTRYEDSNLGYPPETDVADVLHLSLIDNILEMEEKIFAGSLGHLKVKDRTAWRSHILNKNYDELDKTLHKKDENPQIEKLKSEGRNSRPGTPDSVYKDPGRYLGASLESDLDDSDMDNEGLNTTPTNNHQTSVKALAIALVQVSQAVEAKYIKKPLGHADASAKRKEECDFLDKWEQSLLAATSYSQVFLHFCTLDNCIMWGRSVLLARCRICHRQRDPQSMLLCDSCNKGHHLYCLKPKLTAVPKGDWFCNKCKPKEIIPTPRASRKARKIFTEESEDEDEEAEEEEGDDLETTTNGETKTENGADISLFEVCDQCGSGGHVICCDFCPKVYHLECTQPPLRRIPRGEWKCHKCKRKAEKSRDSVDPPYVNGSHAYMMTSVARAQRDGHCIQRRCAAKAQSKIYGFIRSLRRTSVDSGSGEEITTQRRSTRRTQEAKGVEDDDLPLHNAALQELLSDVMKHKDSWPFTRPVTKHEVPDYYDVIKNPMDFGKIKYKLNMGEYHLDAEVMADAALVFENCDTYNNAEALVYKCGVRLLKYFEKRAQELGLKFPEGVMGNIDDSDDDGPTQSKRARHN